ncbi:hypothetical protein Leryth_022930 [Lithospermum erythrorhizon]|nr:hypothetical protein Leryth_022930 [Lithospermum erythrorhizon]
MYNKSFRPFFLVRSVGEFEQDQDAIIGRDVCKRKEEEEKEKSSSKGMNFTQILFQKFKGQLKI